MYHANIAAGDRRTEPIGVGPSHHRTVHAAPPRPAALRSHKFPLGFEDQYADGRPVRSATSLIAPTDRAIDIHLIAVAVFVGGSVLLGCILA